MWDNKNKNVSVTPSNQYVIWNIDISEIAYDATLNVEPGCLGIYIVNGQLRSNNPSGRWLINPKKEKRANNQQKLLGVTADKTFIIHCGVGGVAYKDWELNIETTVGAHGDCRVRILDAWTLYKTLGKTDITPDDVDDYVRAKLSELMTTELASVLQNYDYLTITTEQSRIADALREKFRKEVEVVGLELETFALKKIFFNEKYEADRKAAFEKENKRKEDKAQRREEERRQYAEIDALKSLSEINMGNNNGNNNQRVQQSTFCPKCGNKVDGGAMFCPVCGKKLS